MWECKWGLNDTLTGLCRWRQLVICNSSWKAAGGGDGVGDRGGQRVRCETGCCVGCAWCGTVLLVVMRPTLRPGGRKKLSARIRIGNILWGHNNANSFTTPSDGAWRPEVSPEFSPAITKGHGLRLSLWHNINSCLAARTESVHLKDLFSPLIFNVCKCWWCYVDRKSQLCSRASLEKTAHIQRKTKDIQICWSIHISL